MADSALTPDQLPTTPEARAEFVRVALEKYDHKALSLLFQTELLASAAFADAMAPYDPRGHASFANLYAVYKTNILLRGPRALEAPAHRFLKFREAAAEHLWEIQQKKLFDLQCQWRADQVQLPGCRHTRDFEAWARYVDFCPWLSPVTAAELAVYMAYLQSGTFEPIAAGQWQSYTDFKLSLDPIHHAEAEEKLPAWYAFHNEHTGAGELLDLPDLRGMKEERYVELWRIANQEKQAAAEAAGTAPSHLPWVPSCSGFGQIAPFLDLFEPAAEVPRLHRWRRAVEVEEARSSWELEQAEFWYECYLQPAAEAWPIKANADWRVALREAGIAYWCHQVAEVLVEVWQEQEQNRALGLPVTPPALSKYRKPFEQIDWADEEEWYTKAILRGRELAGEPRNFDF